MLICCRVELLLIYLYCWKRETSFRSNQITIMKTIRKIGNYSIVFEPLQGMYRIIQETENSLEVGFWFDKVISDEYCALNDADFIEVCKNNIYEANQY